MKGLDKDTIMETTPKIALAPLAVALILIFGFESIVGGLVFLALGILVAVVGLILAADTFKQVVSRIMVTLGIIVIGCGLGIMFATEQSGAGLFIAAVGVGFCIWSWLRRELIAENKGTSIVILAATILVSVFMIFSTIRIATSGSSTSSRGNCFNCGGDGWDSANSCSCVWCGGDGYSSWNP